MKKIIPVITIISAIILTLIPLISATDSLTISTGGTSNNANFLSPNQIVCQGFVIKGEYDEYNITNVTLGLSRSYGNWDDGTSIIAYITNGTYNTQPDTIIGDVASNTFSNSTTEIPSTSYQTPTEYTINWQGGQTPPTLLNNTHYYICAGADGSASQLAISEYCNPQFYDDGTQWTYDGSWYGQANCDENPVIIYSGTLPPPPASSCAICNETCSPCGGGCNATDLSHAFEGLSNASIYSDYGIISGWNTSCITNMEWMFYNSGFDQDISGWDTHNVRSMYNMFGSSAFDRPIGNWDVSNVESMYGMFAYSSFNQDISLWNVGNVQTMSDMFVLAPFNGNISNWDTHNVTNMYDMFYGSAFNQPIGNWDVSKVTDMGFMFTQNTVFNQPINDWTVNQVVIMNSMFSGATSFDQNLSHWVTSGVGNMNNIFNGVNLSVNNYDALLNGWANHFQQTGINFDGGNSQYSTAGLSARNTTLIGTYGWTITDGGINTAPECTIDADCGLCMKCDANTCINQTAFEDTKDECANGYTGCLNYYTLMGDSGNCNGAGTCAINDIFQNVTEGQVCIGGTDTTPTSGVYCNEQYNCVDTHGSADGYWTGYLGDGTNTCSDLNWVISGNNWTATTNYTINVTEHAIICQEAPIPCVEDWACNSLGVCNINNTESCLNIIDNNGCGTTFSGTISDYDSICVYHAPSTFTYSNGDDITGMVVDDFGKGMSGIGQMGVIIGILLVAGIAVIVFRSIKKKK
jgi:surface protein